jgi:putative ABC transport system permease protein
MPTSKTRAFAAYFKFFSITYLHKHLRETLLLVLSISIGVGAVVATGALVESAVASIEAAWEASAPGADLRVANGFAGISENLLERVRATPGVASASAILTEAGHAEFADHSMPMLLVAFDLLDDSIHSTPEMFSRETLEVRDEFDLVAKAGRVAVPRDLAIRMNLALGSEFSMDTRAGRVTLEVAGIFASSQASDLLGGAIAVMDLPYAQLMLGREGIVEAIDVMVDEGVSPATVERRLAESVSGTATLTAPGGDSKEVKSILANIRLITGVAGTLAIVVGALIIYNVGSLSISRRKPQLDALQEIGGRRELILAMLSAESILLGLVGSAIGTVLGIGLAWIAASLFQDAIGSLYHPMAASVFRIDSTAIAIGTALGVGLTWIATVISANSAVKSGGGLRTASPAFARRQHSRRLAGVGFVLLAIGLLSGPFQAQWMGPESLGGVVTFGAALVLLGTGLVVPLLLVLISPVLSRFIAGRGWSTLTLAWQGVTSDPSRGAIVIVSIMAGVAYFLMSMGAVGSLRMGVLDWITETHRSDLIVVAKGGAGFLPSSRPLPAKLQAAIESQPSVEAVESIRLVAQPYEDRWIVVAGRDPHSLGIREPLQVVAGDLEKARKLMISGEGVLVSDTLSTKHDVQVGDALRLRTPAGPLTLQVGAVIVDYSGDLGTALISLDTLRSHWSDSSTTAFHVYLAKGAQLESTAALIADDLSQSVGVSVLTKEELYQGAADVVDATFYAAYALELVAALVTIASVLSFFLITLAEREKDIVLLAVVGARRDMIVKVYLYEAAILGTLGILFGVTSGMYLAERLVADTVRVGGGMHLDFVLPVPAIIVSIVGALVISIGGAAWPVLRATADKGAARGELLDV